MRAAIYWAPEMDDPLHALGSQWLGRDAVTGDTLPQPTVPGLDMAALTADARRYGLHATLKPPFHPTVAWPALLEAARVVAASIRPFALPPLRVALLDGFLALRESEPCMALHALADKCVEALDPLRCPPSAAEVARRQAAGLTPAQQAMLLRWGYPYVKSEWRFHVTLTGRLAPATSTSVQAMAESFLGREAARPRLVRELCLFRQAASSEPFLIAERLPLSG